MSSTARTRLIVGLVGVVVIVGAGLYYATSSNAPVERTLTGTLLAIDPAARVATLEFVHPKTQQRFPLRGEVAPECEIVNATGEPVALSDLPIGAKVEAHGLLYRGLTSRRVVATRVRWLDAPTEPTSAPAESTTQPADVAP